MTLAPGASGGRILIFIILLDSQDNKYIHKLIKAEQKTRSIRATSEGISQMESSAQEKATESVLLLDSTVVAYFCSLFS
jgi:hypothetical protein